VATAGLMVKPEERGSAIGTVFLGFSLSTVLGVPLGSLIGAHYGWRVAFGLIGGLSLIGAVWMWLTIPARLYVAPMDGKAWAQLGRNPVVLLLVATTVVHATGQFALFSYLAPALKEAVAASPRTVSMVFLWFGVAGVLGNMVAVKYINRVGAAWIITLSMFSMLAGLTAWSLAQGSLPGVLASTLLWGLGCFSTNMSQQARLVAVAPALASASVALNSSAIYLGQALGSVSGGIMIKFSGMQYLNWFGVLLMAVAIAMAFWTGRIAARGAAAA
jgi:predicted MFS family arabinose efflux permease